MKYVPNALSISRIVLTLLLLLLTVFDVIAAMTLPFLVIYTIAGFTDLFDGPLARKYNVASKLGANLDGIADYFLVAVALFTIVPALNFNFVLIAVIIAVFAGLKILGMIVGYIRFKQLMMMHTTFSKTGAMAAFLFPLTLILAQSIHPNIDENVLIIFLGIYVYMFLIEEIAINIVMPEPKRDIKGIFEAIKIRKQKNKHDRT